jgi:hypothetical protein
MVVRAVILGTDCPGIDAPLFALGQLASSIGSRVGYAFASDVWLVLYRALTPTGSPTTTAPRPGNGATGNCSPPGWADANRYGTGQWLAGHTSIRTNGCGRTHIGKD